MADEKRKQQWYAINRKLRRYIPTTTSRALPLADRVWKYLQVNGLAWDYEDFALTSEADISRFVSEGYERVEPTVLWSEATKLPDHLWEEMKRLVRGASDLSHSSKQVPVETAATIVTLAGYVALLRNEGVTRDQLYEVIDHVWDAGP